MNRDDPPLLNRVGAAPPGPRPNVPRLPLGSGPNEEAWASAISQITTPPLTPVSPTWVPLEEQQVEFTSDALVYMNEPP